MPIPKKVLKGKTIVTDCTIQLVDAIARSEIQHSIIPTKVLENQVLAQQEAVVTSVAGAQIAPVFSFLCIKSQDKFQWSPDSGYTWLTASFVCVTGSFASVQIRGMSTVPSKVTIIAS